jgi:hypothetical protein
MFTTIIFYANDRQSLYEIFFIMILSVKILIKLMNFS